MKDLKDRLRSLLCNPQPHGVEELAWILRDLLDRLDIKPECEHTRTVTLQTGKTVCSLCGKDVSLQFPKR